MHNSTVAGHNDIVLFIQLTPVSEKSPFRFSCLSIKSLSPYNVKGSKSKILIAFQKQNKTKGLQKHIQSVTLMAKVQLKVFADHF